MKVLGYVNRFSRGVARVNHELRLNDNGDAIFDFSKLSVFEVIVHLSSHFKDVEEATQKTTQKTPELSKNQRLILELIKENPQITRNEIADQMQAITPDGVKYHLAELQRMEVIERLGGRKSGYWKINGG